MNGQRWPAVGGRGQSRGRAVGGAAAFVAPFGRKPYRRAELPRPAAPVTGRMRYPPYLPGAAPDREDQAVRLARVAPVAGKVTGTGTERRALSGPPPPPARAPEDPF